MRTAPAHIVEELRRFDPKLRIRWSQQKRRFVIERKCRRRYIKPPIKYGSGPYGTAKVRIRLSHDSDAYISYHDGYIPVADVLHMDRRIFRALYDADTRRFGKYVDLRLDELEAAEERKEEKETESKLEEIAAGVADKAFFKSGLRHVNVMGG